MTNEPLFIIVDLFCGFGGTTTGFDQAMYVGTDGQLYNACKVIACVNHDPKAIKSHWLNHPEVKHFEEDIRTLDLTDLTHLVNYYRSKYPNAKLILWASLECTNFSKAKGGQAREADSRTLAEYLFRYQEALNPDYIQIENVVEFMSWGPLDEKGKPISRKNGQDYMKWRNQMCSYGYYDEWKEMNAADFGAYTSRNRLFGCFAKEGLPIVWPQPTHSKKGVSEDFFGGLKKWKPVKEVLNFSDEGQSIFNRKKPLSDKTLERIYAGLVKYVAKGDDSFIAKYFSGRPEGKVISTDAPAGTITTRDGQALVQPEFLLKYNSINGKTGVHHPPSIEEPAPTVTCQSRLGIVKPEFLQHYYGNGFTTSPEEPCPTLTTKDRVAIVQPKYFIQRDFKSPTHSSVEEPAGSILTVPKLNLVECEPFIMPTDYNNGPKLIENPSPVITADRHWHYIVNPSHGGHSTSTDNPCPVIIARQDKAPLYLIQVQKGEVLIPVYDCDSEVMIKIKVFMAAFGLKDIKMRMLRVLELLLIQGFPKDYAMVGNQSDHKKFIGNSVHPTIPKAWGEIMARKILELRKIAA
jgi:DNA (cytosine-5)-methyltransferase 1